MDVCFLLLVSFLSVFHLSQADQPLEETIIVAKKVQLQGGWTEASPKRKDVQKAAEAAVKKYNMNSKAKNYFKLINITSAHTQVTNMINFKIEATIGKTNVKEKQQLACKFDVTLDPRNDQHEVNSISCKKSI
ncbi:cystatin isoform X3 [Myxocyprinus asiaticus]|uniref:cystatin isoform X3 n=1 Tax=Myxocyprinus asiaticus TaxID=70543 RepID=UPI002222EB58|nr:cystatin isoform X3 [Myxocyprinus asiaticus]